MIGTLKPGCQQVTIVGAGIAGLLLADALDQRDCEVTLLEAEGRAGGLIRTDRTPWGIAECAAHSFLATPAVERLCERLGVELVDVRKESRARYVLRKGKLRRFPLGAFEALGALGRAYFVLPPRPERPRSGGVPPPREMYSLEHWGRRFLGAAAVDYLVSPFVTGIYGVRPGELDAEIAFPRLMVPRGHSLLSLQLHRWIDRRFREPSDLARDSALGPGHRSGRARMKAPRYGMGALTAALEESLSQRLGTRFRKGGRIQALPQADNVVLCVPARDAAGLLGREDPALAEALRSVHYTPLVCATVFATRASFRSPPRGVGVLMPERERRECLGILFNSSAFLGRVEDEAWVSVSVMLGGSQCPEAVQHRDDEIERVVRAELESLFGLVQGSELHLAIRRWPRAIPRYDSKLREAWERAREGWCATKGHLLFGNFAGQVSLRGMIETADEMASKGRG